MNNVHKFTDINYLENYFADLKSNAKKLVYTEEQQRILDLANSPELVRDNIEEIKMNVSLFEYFDIDDCVDVYKESVPTSVFCEWCWQHELYDQYEDAEFTVYIH
jgi:hypothetical protein